MLNNIYLTLTLTSTEELLPLQPHEKLIGIEEFICIDACYHHHVANCD